MEKLIKDSEKYVQQEKNLINGYLVKFYVNDKYFHLLNKPLQSGKLPAAGLLQVLAHIQSFLLNGPRLTDTLIVYRGVHLTKDLQVGDTVENPMLLSTSFNMGVAFGFLHGPCCLLKIVLPKGMRAFAVDGLFRSGEQEVLLPAGTSFRVTEKDSNGTTVLTLQCQSCESGELFEKLPQLKKAIQDVDLTPSKLVSQAVNALQEMMVEEVRSLLRRKRNGLPDPQLDKAKHYFKQQLKLVQKYKFTTEQDYMSFMLENTIEQYGFEPDNLMKIMAKCQLRKYEPLIQNLITRTVEDEEDRQQYLQQLKELLDSK